MKVTIKDRITAHRSAPDVYDPPSFEQMANRIDELEERLKAATDDAKEAEAYAVELEAQAKDDALQYLSDTGQMGETIDDLTRRHEHALRKIDVLEDKLAKAVEALEGVRVFATDLEPYADQGHTLVPALHKARTTLAELKGQDDE